MKSKTLTLAATAIAAALAMSAMPAQAELPKLAGGPAAAAPAAGQTLTHANGYSVTVPSDWVVATDIEGTDFMMGNADLSIICQTFSATGLDMQATDEQIPSPDGSRGSTGCVRSPSSRSSRSTCGRLRCRAVSSGSTSSSSSAAS